MTKRILAIAFTAVTLSLAGCGGAEENNMAVENLEDLNATEDLNVDMNVDVNMDVNATDNATGNEAVDNTTTNSY